MAIDYTYLDPDSPFTADALNTRFDSAMSTLAGGVNNLLPEDFAVGAFRHDHLPRLIGQDGLTLTEFTEQTASIFGDANRFSVMRNNAFADFGAVAHGAVIMELVYGASPGFYLVPAVNVTMDLSESTENVGAILVLANIAVIKLVITDDPVTALVSDPDTWYFPAEERHRASFIIRITDSSGASVDLDKTRRILSPRITQQSYIAASSAYSTATGLTVGTTTITPDKITNQDVAIRTVITPSDLSDWGLTDVNKIALISERGMLTTTVHLGKGNLTAIPIHTKLVSS